MLRSPLARLFEDYWDVAFRAEGRRLFLVRNGSEFEVCEWNFQQQTRFRMRNGTYPGIPTMQQLLAAGRRIPTAFATASHSVDAEMWLDGARRGEVQIDRILCPQVASDFNFPARFPPDVSIDPPLLSSEHWEWVWRRGDAKPSGTYGSAIGLGQLQYRPDV